jgi:two-component system LytT family response regulator
MLKAIIVDDETASIRSLELLLKQFCQEVEVVGTAHTIDEALEHVIRLRPHLVFLDIEMPKGNGFDFLERTPNRNFEVVFITAYENYAVKAFRFSAIDYILKPIEIDELQRAIEKVKERLKNHVDSRKKYYALFENLKSILPNKLVVSTSRGYEYIDLKNVLYFEDAKGSTRAVFSSGEPLLVNNPIDYLEDILEKNYFFRINDNQLVNIANIRRVGKTSDKAVEFYPGLSVNFESNRMDELIARVTEFGKSH